MSVRDENQNPGLSRADLLKRGAIAGGGALALSSLPTLSEAASTLPETKVKELYRIYLSETTDESLCVFSLLLVPQSKFHTSIKQARSFRTGLVRTFRLRTQHDMKASDLVRNSGHLSFKQLTDKQVVDIYERVLRFTASLPGAQILAVKGPNHSRRKALETLLKAVNGRLRKLNSYGVLIDHTRTRPGHYPLLKNVEFYRPLPPQLDPWFSKPDKDTLERLVSQPKLRSGKHIQFVEYSNFASFAVLRHAKPSDRVLQVGIQNSVNLLGKTLVRVITIEEG